ncbi:MAG TPA: hypothetical protein VM869_13020 [Enhygromyxa sp.]|nr:hypothetical protein [Enhygromyxa sp.]
MTKSMLCAALVLALAACAEGCAHERARVDPLAEVHATNLAELERWAWPDPDDAWRPLAEHQLIALEQLVGLLIAEAERAQLSRAQRRQAASLAALIGMELRHATLAIDGRSVRVWVVSEPADDRRGRGTYVIRLGPLAPAHAELLLQAPHDRFDKRTGALALRLLVEGDVSSVRAVFINSAHRYRQLDGSKEPRKPADANPADAAHNPEHPLARTTARALEQRELVLVQLHGFARSAEAGDPDLIVSSGVVQPSRISAAMVERLRTVLPEHPCGHHGIDTERLGGHHNVQGHAARAALRCFVHLELSEELREQLIEDRELRRRFASALPSAAEDSRDCP